MGALYYADDIHSFIHSFHDALDVLLSEATMCVNWRFQYSLQQFLFLNRVIQVVFIIIDLFLFYHFSQRSLKGILCTIM